MGKIGRYVSTVKKYGIESNEALEASKANGLLDFHNKSLELRKKNQQNQSPLQGASGGGILSRARNNASGGGVFSRALHNATIGLNGLINKEQ